MQERSAKRSYAKPRLREYGDVRALTEDVVGKKGKHDGSFYGGMQFKTGN